MNLKKVGKLFGLGVALVVLVTATVEIVGVGQVTMRCVNQGKRETCNQASFITTIRVQQTPSISFLKAPVSPTSPINPQSITYVKPLISQNTTMKLYREKQQIPTLRKPPELRAPLRISSTPHIVTTAVNGAGRALDFFSVTKFASVAKAGKVGEMIKRAPDAIIGALSIGKDFSKIIQPPANITESRR